MTDVRELIALYALGALDAEDAATVERAVEADPSLAVELDAHLALLPPVAPSADVKARLLASVGGGRFERFSARVASVVDVTLDRARELLALIERAASWEQPRPGIELVHFDGGPAYAAADCGFVRLAPGATFPWHAHRGEEVMVVLAGALRDDQGRRFGPGDELVMAEGSSHDLTAEGGSEVIYLARVMNGIEIT
jgi:putative transcriptional regulator